jgi:Protein of unknown function (DUF3592)
VTTTEAPEREHPLGATIAGVVLFVVGMGIAGGVYQINVKERELRRDWISTEGTIAEIMKRRTVDGERFSPLVVFRTSSGTRVSFTGPIADETPRFAIGETVAVRYPSAFPERAEIDYPQRRRLRNAIAIAVAVVLMALGANVAWYASRLQRARAREKNQM